MTEATEYLLGTSRGERERLLRQCEIFDAQARWMLNQIGIQPGGRVLDFGCGPLGILDQLSAQVGSGGAVVGLDKDAQMRERARLSSAERGLENVFPGLEAWRSLPASADRFCRTAPGKIVTAGLLTDREMTDLAEALRAHLNHLDTIVVHPLLFQAWGSKPTDGSLDCGRSA